MSQVHTIQKFIKLLFPSLQNGFIEIRAIHPKTKEVKSLFYPSFDELMYSQVDIDSLSKEFNVYFGVCQRQSKKGDKKAVKQTQSLWVDLDGKDFAGGKEEVLRRLKSFPISPTIIVDSGNGYHVYWLLKEPFEITCEQDIHKIEAFLKAIAKTLGGDLNSAELARVLRLPGTINHKNPDSLLTVSILELNENKLCNLTDFESFLTIEAFVNSPKINPPGWISEALSKINGNRNATFSRIIGRLHTDGLSPDDIFTLLKPHAKGVEFLHPENEPYALEELQSQIKGICSRYPNNKPFPSSTYNSGKMETENRPFEVLHIVKLLEGKNQEIEWRVGSLLAKESAGILAGLPGHGKSWMLLDLAIECAKGGKWLGQFETPQCPVLYIDEESSPGMLRRRLRKLLKAKNLQESTLDLNFCIGQGLCLSRSSSVEQLQTLIKKFSPGLIVIDSLIRVHRAEENSASDMSQVFAVIKGLIREFSCSFLIADHQRKPNNFVSSLDLLLRGSSEKTAFVDTLLSLKRKDDVLIVEHSKSRYAEAVPAFTVSIKDLDSDSTTVTYAGEAEAIKQQARQEVARAFLTMAFNNGEWVARKVLIEQAKNEGIPEKAVDETLKALVEGGLIERDDRKSDNGRGGKAAFYKLKQTLFPSLERGMETETVSVT